MKYWIFYNKQNEDIYAYTASKDIAKRFKEFRDMSNFIEKKIEVEYGSDDSLLLKSDYADSNLIDTVLSTYDNEKFKWTNVTMPLTIMEKISVDNRGECGRIDLQVSAGYDPFIFTDDIIKALDVLQYLKMYESNHNISYCPKIKQDKLKTFFSLYGWTMLREDDK